MLDRTVPGGKPHKDPYDEVYLYLKVTSYHFSSFFMHFATCRQVKIPYHTICTVVCIF